MLIERNLFGAGDCQSTGADMAGNAKGEDIIHHAHEYIDQFRDQERESLISLLVLKKYFEITNGRYQK